jgi:hypothetical protein
MDVFAQVDYFNKPVWDPLAHPESTSQAEYAGSIPVIGSTNPQFGGIFRDCQRPSEVIF